MSKYRTHLLLDPDQHKNLAQLAKLEGRSISELTREFVQEGIEQRQRLFAVEKQRRLQVLEKTRQVRLAIMREHGGVPLDVSFPDLISELREERDDQILSRGD
ncbi:MAG TPA: hypothetical protein VI776_14560 [Anaerolineales bacterium]|jgi:hypothetical protein|nr:hypothetical protein [Anaerolineales bacterium]